MKNSFIYVAIYKNNKKKTHSALSYNKTQRVCVCVNVWHRMKERERIYVWCIIFTVHLTSQPKERYKNIEFFFISLFSSSFFLSCEEISSFFCV